MNLWLTRIRPNLAHRHAARDLGDAVALHRSVMRLFPGDLGEQPRHAAGVLFRVDDDRSGPHVLVQSTATPAPDALTTAYGEVDVKDMTPMLHVLRAGRRVHYRIAANAIRRTTCTSETGRRSEKITILTGPEADHWWHGRAQDAGLAVESVLSQPADTATGRRNATGAAITHQRQWFTGTAQISDPDLLQHHLVHGIGRGRSYGCGLLTLAPAR